MPMLPIGQGVVYLPTRVFQWLEAVFQGAKQGITIGKTVTQSNANGAPPRCGVADMFTSATAHCSLCQMTLLAPWTLTRLF